MEVASPQPPPVTHKHSRQSENVTDEQTTYHSIDQQTSTTVPPHALCQGGRAPEGGSRRRRRRGRPDSRKIAAESLHPQRRMRVGLQSKGGRQHGGEATAGRLKAGAENEEVD